MTYTITTWEPWGQGETLQWSGDSLEEAMRLMDEYEKDKDQWEHAGLTAWEDGKGKQIRAVYGKNP